MSEVTMIILIILGIVGFIFLMIYLGKKYTAKKIREIEAAMKSWLDHNKSELLTKWGTPTSVFQIENGKELWSYQTHRQTSGYAYKVSDTHTRIEAPQVYIVKREFFIDENGKIYNYRWESW